MRQYHLTLSQRMFDFEGFYESIADEMKDGAVMAEVGVADGASAIYLAEAMLNRGKQFTLFMIDSLAYGGTDQLSTILNHICAADLLKHVQVFPYDSLNASCKFPDFHFDFVFLDSSHLYEQTKAEIRLWHRKIKVGGILGGHDVDGCEGVKKAVYEVIPVIATRPPISGQVFTPTPVLFKTTTTRDYGVWWTEKEFWHVLC